MEKNRKQKTAVFLAVTFFLVVFFGSGNSFRQIMHEDIVISSAHADDEDEGDEEDDNFTIPTASTSSDATTVKTKPTYKTVLVTKVITTLDPMFTTDTDKDDIVDGLDPHPTISEKEFFTDDDDDSITNAFDIHKGEDDFAYYEQDNDTNENGILDSFESLGSN